MKRQNDLYEPVKGHESINSMVLVTFSNQQDLQKKKNLTFLKSHCGYEWITVQMDQMFKCCCYFINIPFGELTLRHMKPDLRDYEEIILFLYSVISINHKPAFPVIHREYINKLLQYPTVAQIQQSIEHKLIFVCLAAP